MDIGELLKFQPDKPSGSSLTGQKRTLRDTDNADAEFDKLTTAAKVEKIQKMVEDEPVPDALDESSIKLLILQFEKKTYKNQEMRIKFADTPQKFMQSEIELNDLIQEMHIMATVPQYYPIVVELNSIPSMLNLLSHENTDITMVTVDLLQEMTDVELIVEHTEAIDVFVDALLSQQLFAILCDCLARMDESIKEESDCVHNILSIIENLLELRDTCCIDCTNQGIMDWLLKRLKAKIPFDGNKLFASEILSILVQNEKANCEALGVKQGIDIILQQLAIYKKHNPSTPEEKELMENLFNVLCSALLQPGNKSLFLRGEGLQLMNLMLREKKDSRTSAVKVLNFATGGTATDNCNKLVDILALRSLFPLFMKTPNTAKGLNKKIKNSTNFKSELEENLISIISSMTKNCTGGQRERLMAKFSESDFEKVERLMELHFKYSSQVKFVEDKINKETKMLESYGNKLDDEEKDAYYLQRIEHGLFVLQLIDLIMLEIAADGSDVVVQRIKQILNMKGSSPASIVATITEYADCLGDTDSNKDSVEKERRHISDLIGAFKA